MRTAERISQQGFCLSMQHNLVVSYFLFFVWLLACTKRSTIVHIQQFSWIRKFSNMASNEMFNGIRAALWLHDCGDNVCHQHKYCISQMPKNLFTSFSELKTTELCSLQVHLYTIKQNVHNFPSAEICDSIIFLSSHVDLSKRQLRFLGLH